MFWCPHNQVQNVIEAFRLPDIWVVYVRLNILWCDFEQENKYNAPCSKGDASHRISGDERAYVRSSQNVSSPQWPSEITTSNPLPQPLPNRTSILTAVKTAWVRQLAKSSGIGWLKEGSPSPPLRPQGYPPSEQYPFFRAFLTYPKKHSNRWATFGFLGGEREVLLVFAAVFG